MYATGGEFFGGRCAGIARYVLLWKYGIRLLRAGSMYVEM